MGCVLPRQVNAAGRDGNDTVHHETAGSKTPGGRPSPNKASAVAVDGEDALQGKCKPTAKRMVRKWSVNSLDSTSSALTMDRVAAGHGGTSILKYVSKDDTEVAANPECIMKVYNATEAGVYQQLRDSEDTLRPFTAAFFGEVQKDDLPEDLEGGEYMKLENVLHAFDERPNVMDWKLGIRSFTEAEVTNTKLRSDLFAQMLNFHPDDITEEEHNAQACTKYRWMKLNDAKSTLGTLGFRMDGLENGRCKFRKKELRALGSLQDVAEKIVQEFLPPMSGLNSTTSPPLQTAFNTLQRLCDLRAAMMASDIFRNNEFVGCSLLFVADARGPRAGVYLIDFAHTTPVPSGMNVDHRSQWKPGNHEDGILLGMDNVIACWERVLEMLEEPGTVVRL
eukprot:CAMPEP_0172685872 /NCGR_PEP_ID=MMETSP1074-20121228/20542_1 /TAXON_ID=2916 /ORGANISM="Ceratium fusus, Strain PA161109" /LENGTH=392 /DNA_ID=CAMNT_0013505093 /DNA_START=159 /DNA_END=1337 /DNA_ORIENTATION=-